MADISYTPTVWADGSEGGTPIDAAKLNNIESGIVDAVAAIGPNDTTADGTLKAQINSLKTAITPSVLFNSSVDGTWTAGGTRNLGAPTAYQLFVAFSDGGATPMFGVPIAKSGGGFFVRFGNTYDPGGNTDGHTTYGASFEVSASGVWTYIGGSYIGHSPSSSHGVRHNFDVGRIVRIL